MFARARENARKASCLSNVKQIAQAVHMYLQDYDEVFSGRALPTTYPVPSDAQWWTDLYLPYTKNTQVYRCPSRGNSYWGYGYNTVHLATGTSLASIERVSDLVVIADDDSNYRTLYCPQCSLLTDWDKLPDDRHSGMINCAFADGHAKSMKKSVLYNNGNHSPYYTGK